MITWFKTFIKHNKTNEVGIGLTFVALAFDTLYLAMIFAILFIDPTFQIRFGWWLVLPTVFTVAAVAHLIARPIVMEAYARKNN